MPQCNHRSQKVQQHTHTVSGVEPTFFTAATPHQSTPTETTIEITEAHVIQARCPSCQPKKQWVTLSFRLNQVLNCSLKPKLNLNANSGFKPKLRLTLV